MSDAADQPVAPRGGLDETFWSDLLACIEEKRVIPIIGPDLVFVEEDGQQIPVHRWLARPVAEALHLPANPDAERSLNDVVAEVSRGGKRQTVYPRVRQVLLEANLTPCLPLRQLAEITDFNLYVSTTFDTLLETAINEVRFNGKGTIDVLAYSPTKVADLPCAMESLPRPTVYHLLGKVSATPSSFAIADEDVLEFICALQSEHSYPERLFEELQNSNLLLLGCGFSDWLGRFFLRMAKRKRLSEPRDVLEVVADRSTPPDPELVMFLQNVSSSTKLFPGDPVAFVAELSRRWKARSSAGGDGGGGGAEPMRFLPPAHEMPENAIFISYAHEDMAAAQELKAGLDAAGLSVWFDVERLEPGDEFNRKIKRNIGHCSFILPLISANTERRTEGYFRREWLYAVDRAEGMAEGMIFILPIVIDDTRKDEPVVPQRFTEVQWTSLPGGKVTQEFVRRMVDLTASKAGA